MQTSVAPPGPSKLVQSTTADEVDQAEEDDDEEEGNDSEDDGDEDEEDDDEEEAEQDGDASMGVSGTPGKKMTARQQEKAAEKKLKAAQRSAKKVGTSKGLTSDHNFEKWC